MLSLTSNFDFNSAKAAMDAQFEAQVAEMKVRHNAGVQAMHAEANAIRKEMAAEREAFDSKFHEHLSALEEKQVVAAVDHLVTNICMLLNTTRRFS